MAIEIRKAVGLWQMMEGSGGNPKILADLCLSHGASPEAAAAAYLALGSAAPGMTASALELAKEVEACFRHSLFPVEAAAACEKAKESKDDMFRFPAELPAGLNSLMPLSSLEMPESYREALSGAGISTLGELAGFDTAQIGQIEGLKGLGPLASANMWQIVLQLKKLFADEAPAKKQGRTQASLEQEPKLPFQVAPATSIYSLGLSSGCARALRDCGIIDASQMAHMKKSHVSALRSKGVSDRAILLAVKTSKLLRKIFEEKEDQEKAQEEPKQALRDNDFLDLMQKMPERRLNRPISAFLAAKPSLKGIPAHEGLMLKDLGALAQAKKDDPQALEKIKELAQFAASDFRDAICRKLDVFFMAERCNQTFLKMKEWIMKASDLAVRGNASLEQFRLRFGLEIGKLGIDPVAAVCADIGSPYWAQESDVAKFYGLVKESALLVAMLRTPALHKSPVMTYNQARKAFIRSDAAADIDQAEAEVKKLPKLADWETAIHELEKAGETISGLALSIEFERLYAKGGDGVCYRRSITLREFLESVLGEAVTGRFTLSENWLDGFRKLVERLSLGAFKAPSDNLALTKVIEGFCLDCGDGSFMRTQELERLSEEIKALWMEIDRKSVV
jgi:arsenate reductase-like glutaredoxin family protein